MRRFLKQVVDGDGKLLPPNAASGKHSILLRVLRPDLHAERDALALTLEILGARPHVFPVIDGNGDAHRPQSRGDRVYKRHDGGFLIWILKNTGCEACGGVVAEDVQGCGEGEGGLGGSEGCDEEEEGAERWPEGLEGRYKGVVEGGEEGFEGVEEGEGDAGGGGYCLRRGEALDLNNEN